MRNDQNKYAQQSIAFLNHTSTPFGGFGVKNEQGLTLFSSFERNFFSTILITSQPS